MPSPPDIFKKENLQKELNSTRYNNKLLNNKIEELVKQNEILTLRANIAQELEQKGFVKITEYLK